MKLVIAGATVLLLVAGVLAQTDKGSVEQQLVALEHKWNDAFVKRDTAAKDTILASTFVSTEANGIQGNKAQFIADATSPDTSIESATLKDLRVQVYGDAAVVTGTTEIKGSYKGKPLPLTTRFTDTFIRQNGTWRVVASHASVLK